jgi:tripartite-type tricarboxylate transporter receptor subunit TctC
MRLLVGFSRVTLAVCAACASLGSSIQAQNFPSKSIRFLVGAAPGGGADFVARALSPKLTESLGQPVVVVKNRPRANGVVASELLARAAPDGETINPSLMKLSFDFPKKQEGDYLILRILHQAMQWPRR